MDKENYHIELWEDIKQVDINLRYIDAIRARKARVEPIYKEVVSIISISTAILNLFKVPYYTEIISIVTAFIVFIPLSFPLLFPAVETFLKIDSLRLSLKERFIALEGFWGRDRCETEYEEYRKSKIAYASVETEASALFGIISKKLQKQTLEESDEYLKRRFISSLQEQV